MNVTIRMTVRSVKEIYALATKFLLRKIGTDPFCPESSYPVFNLKMAQSHDSIFKTNF